MRILLISALLFITANAQYEQRAIHPPGIQPSIVRQSNNRPVQRGYLTNQRSGPAASSQAGGYGPQSAPVYGPPQGSQVSVSAVQQVGYDFNPALAGGFQGYPGVKARINQRGFQYFSTLISPILDREIKRARIPPISQCVPQVNGCIQVYNLYVSRYRCPQRVVLYPAPPNKIVIAVQNLDVGVTGNLGGQINILVPIKLFGIIQVNAHQVSITVELTISRGPTGAPYITVSGCTATIGYLDAYIENGGLVGDIANSQFRQQISNQVKQMVPSQLCAQLPQIVNEKLNSQLGAIPQSIALTQMLQLAGGALGLGGSSGGSSCTSSCGGKSAPAASSQPLPTGAVGGHSQSQPKIPKANVPPPPPPSDETFSTKPGQASAPPPSDVPPSPSYAPSATNSGKPRPSTASSPYARRHVKVVAAGAAQLINRPISNSHFINSASSRHVVANARFTRDTQYPPHARVLPVRAIPVKRVAPARARALGSSGVAFQGAQGAAGGAAFPPANAPNACGGCPGASTDTLSQLKEITKYLDISKLNDIYLTVQLLQTYATLNDYTIDLNGEFSQGGRGGTPFGPFPMQFPYPVGHKMAEILISDYTINSLFYTLHRKEFLSVKLGPETPKIGSLLKTTCSEDDDYELEDHGVETDEAESTVAASRRVRSPLALIQRNRRQADDGGLADLGICFGDILPAAREKFPNENIIINVRTSRAPSVILSSKSGGTAILDISADADMFTESKHTKIGTIRVEATFEVQIKATSTGISGHGEITRLKLTNPDQGLGLTQEALDNLGNLGKELVAKAANDVLEKGIPLSVPSGGAGLPLNFIQPEFHILEHAIHLESDFTISQSFIDQLAGSGGSGGYGGVCSR